MHVVCVRVRASACVRASARASACVLSVVSPVPESWTVWWLQLMYDYSFILGFGYIMWCLSSYHVRFLLYFHIYLPDVLIFIMTFTFLPSTWIRRTTRTSRWSSWTRSTLMRTPRRSCRNTHTTGSRYTPSIRAGTRAHTWQQKLFRNVWFTDVWMAWDFLTDYSDSLD